MRRARALAYGLVGLLLAACDLPGTAPSAPPSPRTTGPRPFTVMSTDPIRVADPAAVTETGSTVLSQNAFQRLLTSDPGEPALKPDAARDCLFTAATTYTCTLNQELVFHNGHPLTSSDVRFSITRAARLAVPGSSASLLSSLRRIETPDPLTVRFELSRPDTQFGWALAAPAASIVDEEVYDADEIRALDAPVVGSGPFQVARFDAGRLDLRRHEAYVGRHAARSAEVSYQTVPESASIEDAMAKGAVDVVWRGLNAAAVTRYDQQVEASPEERTVDGFRIQPITGARVHQLQWAAGTPKRQNPALRKAIALALQGDRTSASVVPNGVPGYAESFPAGGRARPEVTWSRRIQLTLGYDPSMPNGRDIATQIRTRLEDTGGLSVRLRPGEAAADLLLVDRKAWTPTALAWLQPYLDTPLPGSRALLASVEARFRASTTEADSSRLLTALQRQAAIDATVLPLSQASEFVFVRDGAEVSATSFGPGWQLGLWGMRDL